MEKSMTISWMLIKETKRIKEKCKQQKNDSENPETRKNEIEYKMID